MDVYEFAAVIPRVQNRSVTGSSRARACIYKDVSKIGASRVHTFGADGFGKSTSKVDKERNVAGTDRQLRVDGDGVLLKICQIFGEPKKDMFVFVFVISHFVQ